MINFKNKIASYIAETINLDENQIEGYIEVPKDGTNGDYAFPCFKLAKELRKAPPAIAAELKEKIEVDEKGTKASAVTGIMMKNEAAVLDREEINFIVLQPFIYVIRDIKTGTILFMGNMQDMV